MVLIAVLAACQGHDDPDPDPGPDPYEGTVPDVLEITGAPAIGMPGLEVWLARWFTLVTDEPTTLSLVLEGPERTREIRFPELVRTHRVPLLGLRADTTYTVTATVTAEDGESAEAPPLSFASGSVPDDVPFTVADVSVPDRMEPGLTLMSANDETGWLLATDAEGVTIYAQHGADDSLALVPDAEGNLWSVDGYTITVRSPMGEIVRRWTPTPTGPVDIGVAYPDFHHEVLPQPDGGFWALSYRHEDVDAYPTDYVPPFTFAPATIRNDLVVRIAPDGSTIREFAMLDLLDIHRIGFDSLSEAPSGALDWVHSNALQYDADTEMLTVSLRHQDAVVRFSAITGEIAWIFASPHGWPPDLAAKRLVPTAEMVWPTHQHGVQVTADGRIRLFDNGNDLHGTPYYTTDQTVAYSRIFEAEIDEVALTVTPVAEYSETSVGPLYAAALGNADLLPATRNRLGTWGPYGRVVEFTEDGEIVFEFMVLPDSYRVDRALRVPSLYPSSVTEIARED